MEKVTFKDKIKENKPKLIKRVLFYLYRLKHNKYYSCHIWELCFNCEYFNICYDEKGADKQGSRDGTGSDETRTNIKID